MFSIGSFGSPIDEPNNPSLASGSRDDSLASRLSLIRNEVARICVEQGRDYSSVQIMGVSKHQSVEAVQEAIDAGLEDFGENYVQEGREKAVAVAGARWHLLGPLQSNKVNLAVDLFESIHSLHSLAIIQKVEKRCEKRSRRLTGLIQVCLGGESSKRGFQPEELLPLLDEIAKDPPSYLKLSGLMTIPPAQSDPEHNRPYFRQLKELLVSIQEKDYSFWRGSELSMGMSDDYTVAVEEGATIIRLGRALFGEREV